MIICPNPDCTNDEMESFEVETRYGSLGSGLWVDCPSCDHSFEVEVLVLDPRPALPTFPPQPAAPARPV